MQRIDRFWFLGANLIGVVVFYILSNLQKFALCENTYSFGNYIGCSDPIIESIGQPFLIFFLLTLPVFAIFFFVRQEKFETWKKFTLWWLILSAIIILATPTSSNTWMPLYSLEREGVTWIMGILFALISFGIIVWKSAKK